MNGYTALRRLMTVAGVCEGLSEQRQAVTYDRIQFAISDTMRGFEWSLQ